MQAPPTESLPALSCCDWCFNPLILCPDHSSDSELVPYAEHGPSLLYNELIDWIDFHDAAETFRQIAASTELVPYGETGPSYNEVIDGFNSAVVDGGESSTAETFRQTVASKELVAASNSRRTTGTGRFPCTVAMCQADFTARHNLQSHIDSHYGRKNHHCMGCGSSLTTKASLKRHRPKCKKTGVL